MRRDQAIRLEQSIDRTMQDDSDGQRGLARSEALHIRSYDYQWSYDLDVELVSEDGDTAFQAHYYLRPGHTESESGIVPRGEYELRVTLDNKHEETFECLIDATPDGTAVIEVGNGAFAITNGLQG